MLRSYSQAFYRKGTFDALIVIYINRQLTEERQIRKEPGHQSGNWPMSCIHVRTQRKDVHSPAEQEADRSNNGRRREGPV